MDSEQPIADDVKTWAERERKRRADWLTGPSDEEKADWAQRYKRRALFGFAESRLGPTREEVEEWAARETKRRKAWLEGPTEDEKREWLRTQRWRGRLGLAESPLPPSTDEVEAWAARERVRRREWLGGPTAEEAGARRPETTYGSAAEDELFDLGQRLLREAELAGKGSVYSLARAPLAIWSRLVRAGGAFEEEFSRPPRRGRVPY